MYMVLEAVKTVSHSLFTGNDFNKNPTLTFLGQDTQDTVLWSPISSSAKAQGAAHEAARGRARGSPLLLPGKEED